MKFKVIISETAYKKVQHWVHKTSREVSGFGITSIAKDGDTTVMRVHDAYLLEQEVSGTHTDIDAKSLSKLMSKVLKNPETRMYNLNWWWHSHVMMPVFWSGTDTETIKDIGKNGLCIATVFNQKTELRSAICYNSVSEMLGDITTFVDDIATVYEYTPDPRIPDWDKEFDDNVKTPAVTPYQSSYLDGRWEWDEYNRSYKPGDTQPLLTANKVKDNPKLSKDMYDWGIIGFGVKIEAAALKISKKQLATALRDQDQAALIQYEEQLYQLVEQGALAWPT